MLPGVVRDEDTGEMVETRCSTLVARIAFHTNMAPAKSVLHFTRDKVDCPSARLAGADFTAELVIIDTGAESLGASDARAGSGAARKPPVLAVNLREYAALSAGMSLTSKHLDAELNFGSFVTLVGEGFDADAASAAVLVAGAGADRIGQARVWLRTGLLAEIGACVRDA